MIMTEIDPTILIASKHLSYDINSCYFVPAVKRGYVTFLPIILNVCIIRWAWGGRWVGIVLREWWAWLRVLGGAQGSRPPVPASSERRKQRNRQLPVGFVPGFLFQI